MPRREHRHPHIKHAALRTVGVGANLAWRIAGNIPHTPTRRTRVAIIHDDHVLLIKNITDFKNWKLPGGGLHKGEDPYAGAIREVHEELKVTLRKADLQLIGEFTDPQRGAVYTYDGFIATVSAQPELEISWEIAHTKWFPLANLPPNVAPYILELLRKGKVI